MRARVPDQVAEIVRDGVRIGYDVYGAGNSPTVVLLPTWAVAGPEHWKSQVPTLARRHQVVVVHGRGVGRSDRPEDATAYRFESHARDAVAVLDALDIGTAVFAGLSCGGLIALMVAALFPARVSGAVSIAPPVWAIGETAPHRKEYSFTKELDVHEGWALYNQHAWRRDYEKFADFFWGEIFTEPHSTKQLEDGRRWARDIDGEVLIKWETGGDPLLRSRESIVELLTSIRCPVLMVHGTEDRIQPLNRSELIADLIGADLLVFDGGGHGPMGRDPIRFNRALIDFVERVSPAAERPPVTTTWTRAMSRPKRALYLSSPIGLGHARRDLAIARALREEHSDLQIDWLAQDPVTTFLAGTGETVHPASAYLAAESAHFASEAHEHSLHAFQAVRRMDEILIANFAVFQDLVDGGDYDLVVADESWDVDYFWHENPELKRTAYVWMTDFVGWIPMASGGESELSLTADYNSEMLEQVARFKRLRDRSIFVGDPDDIVPASFGPGLPDIREWTEKHYAFSGYITGFDPAELADRGALRRQLGHGPDPLVVVTVGGSGVGVALLRKVIDAYPLMRDAIPNLRMLAVAGPRIDIAVLPSYDGVDVCGYVPDLHLHLAACDAAIVQGGLTSTMELVANRRPFLYFPLGDHFEQQHHVQHRLKRHRAGGSMDFETTDAPAIAAGLVEQLAASTDYLPVPSDGAAKAAALIAELI